MIFYQARWYDANLNRWTSPDNVIPDYYNSLDWDRYSYTRNNSVKYVDSDGHFPIIFLTPLAISFALHAFGLVPDTKGIMTAYAAMTLNGNNRIDVAAALAVQSEWLTPYDYVDTGSPNHGMGIAQISNQQMYGVSGDPRFANVAIEAMAARIDTVVQECAGCTAFDKLVAIAMAQNGAGFDKVAMQQVVKRYMKDGQINWQAFFKTRGWKENYTDIRAIGRENFDTRYMVYLYATDLYALYLLGWELPKGITEDDLFEMMKLGWGTNEKSYEAK